ncbi:MAG: glycosyltransferase family 4 protein [Nitrospirae bacterium]|nr:glycosyltransferase family 4 protein [Nitrospirota bacterium]
MRDIIAMLAARGHEIHIYAIDWDDDSSSPGVRFHRVPAMTFNSFLRDLTFAWSCLIMLKRRRGYFDIIQTHDKTLYQDICFVADGCHIEWLRQRWKRKGLPGKLSIMLNPYHWLILLIEMMMYNGHRFKRIFALSHLVKKDIVRNYHVSGDEIDVVYHWIDTGRFHPDNREKYRKTIRVRHSVADEDFVILFVGSGFERKGVEYIIRAAEMLSGPATVLIVGKGDGRPYQKFLGKQKVIFCGAQKEVHEYYAASDIFILAPVYEPLGLVFLEAMASGLPVITTRSSGAAELIKNGVHGYVVDGPEDIRGIAGSMQVLADDPELLKAMSKNARSLAEEFTFEKHIGRMTALYEAIIDDKG